MGRTYASLEPSLVEFLTAQHLFFVATAPSVGGHVNLSPKGLDTFRVLDDERVGYLDLTGSGVETIAHLRENGRITLMFCAFEGPPRIVRLQGDGTVTASGEDGYDELVDQFPAHRGARAVITVRLDRIADSCGWSVPLLDYVGDRNVLDRWAERKSEDELVAYRNENNAVSIDGVPGFPIT